MNKIQYDNYFTSQLPKMRESIPRLISRYGKTHLETDVVINETYIYCLEFIDIFNNESICQSYIYRFINFNISKFNSKMNRKEKINNITEGYLIPEEIDDIEENLKVKLQIENWFNSRRATLSQYRQQLTDKQKIIIYDCFFIKGMQTGKDMGNHLGINKDYALQYIREMKDDIIQYEIREFIKNNIKTNNKPLV